MNIVIEARALSADFGGVRTYVQELIRHMVLLGDEHSITALYDSEVPVGAIAGVHERVALRRSDLLLPWWLNVQVPSVLGSINPDVVHFTKADIPRRKKVPTVVTIYDTIPLRFPQSQAPLRRLYWPGALRRAAQASDKIITISEASRIDIMDQFGVDPKKIAVTPLPVDTQYFRAVEDLGAVRAARQKHGLPTRYILFLGTRDIRKNIASLVRAFADIADEFPHHLVIAGKPALRSDGLERVVSELGLTGKVHILGGVPYADLPALYSMADLFVFPSVYEGWGFPVLEAMACGVPAIVSNAASLPEAAGEAAEVVDFAQDGPRERMNDEVFVQRLAERMRLVLSDPTKQERMRAAGLARVQQFSWAEVAKRTLAVYRELV